MEAVRGLANTTQELLLNLHFSSMGSQSVLPGLIYLLSAKHLQLQSREFSCLCRLAGGAGLLTFYLLMLWRYGALWQWVWSIFVC